ncbi:uncharacterized protein N7515_006599 [Penicillium bovifimosum]|uniref:Uncharacterized protein n=1 Tax=Penicillium bovifimosum TaxID=126998 RepID=A0A9W9GV03_9EURO|nr:uncharacterized protein N7515_006599 [Penicillium bovifimosum]KAJ5130560.1 hypothetical protein N7515_006599 [Penicillium bovifimosum]
MRWNNLKTRQDRALTDRSRFEESRKYHSQIAYHSRLEHKGVHMIGCPTSVVGELKVPNYNEMIFLSQLVDNKGIWRVEYSPVVQSTTYARHATNPPVVSIKSISVRISRTSEPKVSPEYHETQRYLMAPSREYSRQEGAAGGFGSLSYRHTVIMVERTFMMGPPDRPRLPEVRAALETAVNARGAAYHSKAAVFFYFEIDDTGAKDDVVTLSNCFKDVFAMQPTVMELAASDRMPGLSLMRTIHSTIENMEPHGKALPCLLVLAYVGHGTIDATTGKLKLVAGATRQNIQWPLIHNSFFAPTYATTNVDTLGILDCCYYSGATRERSERASRNLKANGGPFATVEDLVVEINREKTSGRPDAVLTYDGGTRPIAIPFKGTSSASVQRALRNLSLLSPETTTQSILVELSIAGTPAQILEEFKDVIASLPGQFRVGIVDVYQSTSVLFLLRMSQLAHLRLSSTLDFRIIGKIYGQSLMRPD